MSSFPSRPSSLADLRSFTSSCKPSSRIASSSKAISPTRARSTTRCASTGLAVPLCPSGNTLTQLVGQIWEVFEEILVALSWTPEEAVSRLEANWKRFISPPDKRPEPKVSNREKKRERKRVDLYVSDEEGG